MNIHQAINRIVFRFKGIKANQLDQEALDALIDFVNIQNESGYMNNLLFGKLFVEYFMLLAQSGDKDASGCLSFIEEILQEPLYKKVERLSENVPLFKFENTVHKYVPPLDPFDFDKIRKERIRVANERQKELISALKSKYTIEQAIDFLTSQVNRLDKLYNKKELA